MLAERSAGAIIFRETKKERVYFLIQHQDSNGKPGHWDFPKGHIEKGEKTQDAVRREVTEETGIRRITFVPGFKETIRYFVKVEGKKRLKFVVFFLAKKKKKKIALSFEHQDFVWFPYEKAYRRLTYSSPKQVLKKARHFLSKKGV